MPVLLAAQDATALQDGEWQGLTSQGPAAGASSSSVPAATTQQAGEKTSQAVCLLTEIALVLKTH